MKKQNLRNRLDESSNKLRIGRITVRQLDRAELSQAAGASDTWTTWLTILPSEGEGEEG